MLFKHNMVQPNKIILYLEIKAISLHGFENNGEAACIYYLSV